MDIRVSGKVSPLPDAVKARRGNPRACIADPLLAQRYSAMHRNPYNLVYRLTPFEAYRQSLVKKNLVASVVKEDDLNQVCKRVEEIRTGAKKVQAKIALHKRMAGATIKKKSISVQAGRLP